MGRGVMPGCVATRNAISSRPCAEGSADLFNCTENAPPTMPSSCMAAVIDRDSRGAALARVCERERAASRYALACRCSASCKAVRSAALSSRCSSSRHVRSNAGNSSGISCSVWPMTSRVSPGRPPLPGIVGQIGMALIGMQAAHRLIGLCQAGFKCFESSANAGSRCSRALSRSSARARPVRTLVGLSVSRTARTF